MNICNITTGIFKVTPNRPKSISPKICTINIDKKKWCALDLDELDERVLAKGADIAKKIKIHDILQTSAAGIE